MRSIWENSWTYCTNFVSNDLSQYAVPLIFSANIIIPCKEDTSSVDEQKMSDGNDCMFKTEEITLRLLDSVVNVLR